MFFYWNKSRYRKKILSDFPPDISCSVLCAPLKESFHFFPFSLLSVALRQWLKKLDRKCTPADIPL